MDCWAANGAGKTTTLRILATILEPTDGTALVCGHDVVEQPEKVRANVGFLSTATALYPRLTAQELVEYFGRLNGLDEATLKEAHRRYFQPAGHERISRPALRQAFHRNEAEDFDCADIGA